ncbi:ZN112 protein, partial [Acromyrmex heyeri]
MSSKSQNSQNLNQHERKHNDPKGYICYHCDKEFTFTRDFTKHNKEVHKEVKPYKCRKCGKTFQYEADLLRHEPIHAGEKPYKCKSCEASFKTRDCLNYHISTIHIEIHKCDKCSCTFASPSHLERHLEIHAEYICEICGKGFLIMTDKDMHSLEHDKKLFKCSVCGDYFKGRRSLRRHERNKVCNKVLRSNHDKDLRSSHNEVQPRFVYSNKKRFECLVCDKGFVYKKLLRTHFREQHKDYISDTCTTSEEQTDKKADIESAIHAHIIHKTS